MTEITKREKEVGTAVHALLNLSILFNRELDDPKLAVDMFEKAEGVVRSDGRLLAYPDLNALFREVNFELSVGARYTLDKEAHGFEYAYVELLHNIRGYQSLKFIRAVYGEMKFRMRSFDTSLPQGVRVRLDEFEAWNATVRN